MARFLALDPLAKDYPSLSDYSYVAANPILFIDPTGKAVEDIVINGSNGSSRTILTDEYEAEFSVDYDFGGNEEIEMPTIGFGLEVGFTGQVAPTAGPSGTASIGGFMGGMMFTTGKYKDYAYNYFNGEIGVGGGFGTGEIDGAMAINRTIAFGSSDAKPSDLGGESLNFTGGFDIKAPFGAGLNVQVSFSEKFTIFSFGGEVNFGLGAKASAESGMGTTSISQPDLPTNERSFLDKAVNMMANPVLYMENLQNSIILNFFK